MFFTLQVPGLFNCPPCAVERVVEKGVWWFVNWQGDGIKNLRKFTILDSLFFLDLTLKFTTMEEQIQDLELAVAELKRELDQLKEFKAETIKFIEESLTYSKHTNDTLVKHAESMEQLRTANSRIIRTITELSTLIRR